MTMDMAQQSTQNMAYVRRLLRQKQPGFSAALELAVLLTEQEQRSRLPGGFARDFGTADGERVMVAAFTRQQFADLVKTARLARTFAFLERVLCADFSATHDLYTYRVTIAALLAPWFARRTMADLTVALAGTSVLWARLHNLGSQPASRR
jgi:crotonobetainyl-CoA:carnitine CoA-transferase CaiB-like acyl-CoA transferase